MTAKVILNPYSNRWNAKARWPEAKAALKQQVWIFHYPYLNLHIKLLP